ncbi:hypothetical protein PISMIDRAFT_13331 [Pisolithus microcarpus 441]|uniref:Uncharacterized protein n=1 Tax=Pisolithus microcarpus 441 TaxID=765257 RepID=A0A0C9ZIW5_9AGAM|nr:hypothetical protein PISMIDRAFT_13331 [Pisolithus microcarpus 441]
MVKITKYKLNEMEDDDVKEWIMLEDNLMKEERGIKALNKFYDETIKFWSKDGKHVLGYVAYSPPLTFFASIKGYTED